MVAARRLLSACLVAVAALAPPVAAARRRAAVARAGPWPACGFGGGQPAGPNAVNIEVLERLFGRGGDDEGGAAGGAGGSADDEETEGAEGLVVYCNEKDAAFLGVIAKLLDVLDSSGSGPVGPNGLADACRHAQYPDFLDLVGKIFAEADEDGDGALNAEEVEQFTEILKSHIAETMLAARRAAKEKLAHELGELLRQHPHGGVSRQHVADVAASAQSPHLAGKVGKLFDKADSSSRGFLDQAQTAVFWEFLEDALRGPDSEEEEDDDYEAGTGADSDSEAEEVNDDASAGSSSDMSMG